MLCGFAAVYQGLGLDGLSFGRHCRVTQVEGHFGLRSG